MALASSEGWLFLLRWIHFFAGITWIGILYYFNFVQTPFFAETEAPVRSGAILHAVLRRPADAAGKPATASEQAIADAAKQTGGRVWDLSTTGDIVGVLTQVFEHFKQNYVLSFVPKGVPRDGWHELSVDVPGLPGARVVARKGYFGG